MYRVIWEIDVDAANPLEAAKRAKAYQLDRLTSANVFTVQDAMGDEAVEIDLDVEPFTATEKAKHIVTLIKDLAATVGGFSELSELTGEPMFSLCETLETINLDKEPPLFAVTYLAPLYPPSTSLQTLELLTAETGFNPIAITPLDVGEVYRTNCLIVIRVK